MCLSDVAARKPSKLAARRRAGYGWIFAQTIILAAVGMAITFVGSVRLHAQADKNLIGKRVVQKSKDFTLRLDNRVVETKNSIYIFRVERIDGPSVLLQANGCTLSGWASADSVVPVEQAIDFFTGEVRARPLDPFPRMMRAMIWGDEQETDKAIADYSVAI